jgi:HK97 family phage prohead protease
MLNRTITIDLTERERKAAAPSRRFPVSVSSETPVPRRDWQSGQVCNEVLSHAATAVDLSRAPLPLLEGHDSRTTNVGIVTSLRLDGGRLRGELVLGESQRARELAADIGAGIVTGLSVGYVIDAQERDEKAKRITARRWTPFEVSITPIPADLSVGINRSHAMDEPTTTTTPAEPTTTRTEPSPEATERQRAGDIVQLVERAHLPATFAHTLVTEGVTLERAREMVLNVLADRDAQVRTEQHIAVIPGGGERHDARSPITPGSDFAEDFRAAAIDALLIRSGIAVAKPHAAARDVSASVYDLARLCLSRAGKPGSRMFGGEMSRPDLLKRAATTSDYPLILSGALHAAIRNGYETEPASHRAWVRPVPVQDFRDQERPILGSAPALEAVPEHAEYKNGYFTEDSAKYAVAKYGKIVSLSWEILVNDNLGAFLRVQPALGQAARRLEADTIYALFALNGATGPTMQDTKALWHADHGNLVSVGAALSASQLGAGRALLRKQTALGGGYMSLVPRFLIVPPTQESAAELLLANAARPATGTDKTTGAWIASLELVVEPRLLDTTPFPVYLAADSAQVDTCELGLLEENMAGPTFEEERGFRIDDMSWRIRHVFGAKFLDWRGIVKVPCA